MPALDPFVGDMPLRTQPQETFDANMANMVAHLPVVLTQWNAAIAAVNALFAGTAMALPYTFSATTTDADPTPGFMRLDNATQNAATTIRLDLVGADGSTWTSLIDAMAGSNSAVKGQIRVTKFTDPSKWAIYNVTAVASPSGYKNVAVTPVSASATNPFTAGDPLVLMFTRTGDVGTAGTIVRRPTTIPSSATPTPDSTNTDIYTISALAAAATFGAPTGTPSHGQGLMLLVKDNGTSRAFAWNSIYMAGLDLSLPAATTVGKWILIGFVYNAVDTKWILSAVLNNI